MKEKDLKLNDIIGLEYYGIPCYAKVVEEIDVFNPQTFELITKRMVKAMIRREDNSILYENFALNKDCDYTLVYREENKNI